MVWRAEDPQGNEAAKVRWDIVPYTNGTGLDLGCGPFKAFPHFIGVDNGHHWGTQGADVAVDTCERLTLFATGSMDFVFSSHLLEHIQDWQGALREWWRVIKEGGHLCLYLPHKKFYPNCGQPGANPDHKHDFMPEDIRAAMRGFGDLGAWELVEDEERNGDREYSFFQVYRKLAPGEVFHNLAAKPKKTAAIVRYGAFGDLIQTSSLFPWLKKQGYHVTVYTSNGGHEVIKHDPHIDRCIVQATDQVPNPMLGEFWEHTAKKYDKFINLSESVEASLLAMPGRMNHSWPDSVRRKYLNVNYLQFMHEIAEVPFYPDQQFYPTEEETAWAKAEREKLPGKVVLWSLAGSAVHKTWPHLDTVMARLLLQYPDLRIVLVGDHLCQLLEAGWEHETRVLRRSGVWSIRQSLAFAPHADLVVGPETGVLNSVAFSKVPKIVTLSHSSVENLTRDWRNTVSLTPEDTPCYPCHRLHYNFDHCPRDEHTGCAKCQANIGPDAMWAAINEVLNRKH